MNERLYDDEIAPWIVAGALAAYLAWWILPGYLAKKEDPRSAAYLGKIAAEIKSFGAGHDR